MEEMEALERPSVPCQKALGAGDLCGMPSQPGWPYCRDHIGAMQKKALKDRIEEVQETVYALVADQVENAVLTIVGVMNSEVAREDVKLKAAQTVLTLAGADLAAPSAHEQRILKEQRKELKGLLPADDEQLIILVQKINPERGELMKQRAIEAASREP